MLRDSKVVLRTCTSPDLRVRVRLPSPAPRSARPDQGCRSRTWPWSLPWALSRAWPTLAWKRERAGRLGIGQGELIVCGGEMIAEDAAIESPKPPREIR